jgi:effector-binding domain-containing protein
MVEFAAELGVALSGVGYEHYTSMPDAKPEDMTTEIYLPIQAAKKKE